MVYIDFILDTVTSVVGFSIFLLPGSFYLEPEVIKQGVECWCLTA